MRRGSQEPTFDVAPIPDGGFDSLDGEDAIARGKAFLDNGAALVFVPGAIERSVVERLVAGLTSYWVHQHIGNLAPEELARDEIWRRLEGAAPGEVDLTGPLRALAEQVDRHPERYRWSYTRALGGSRLVMLDSRAARVLEPERRAMLDDDELAWLGEQLTGDLDHLFIGTSLPFLLPPGLHDAEAISEALAGPGRSRPVRRATEVVRQAVDLEHWGAFSSGFVEVFELVMSVARGERGRPPATITFLSGDVHHSYVADVAV